MSRKITEKTFYQYLKCPQWVYFSAHENETRLQDPLLSKLIEDGLADDLERSAIRDRSEVVEVTAEDPEEAFRQTLAFMQEGKKTIYGGVLVDGHWVGNPDVLEQVEGKSHLGNYYYVAADVKRSRRLRDDYKFQGCFYAELLDRIQGVKPVNGYVITPDGEALEFLIDEFEGEYKLTLDEIERIIAGKRPVHFVTSSCKQSPWFEECKSQSAACNEISLLNRVWHEEVVRLEGGGIKTIDALAAKSVHEIASLVPDVSIERIEVMRDQAIAIREGVYIRRGKIDLPESEIELFFDIESNPLRDFDYLFGVLVVDGKGQETYHSFFAERPEDEPSMWKEFVSFIESHIDAPIYHYGWFEQEVVGRFGAKYGISELAKDALERNMIDILFAMRPAVLFPLTFYSLKDVASYLGFSWRAEDASGANSVLWMEEYMKTKDKKIKKKILEYNEDDVRATYVLQKWLREELL